MMPGEQSAEVTEFLATNHRAHDLIPFISTADVHRVAAAGAGALRGVDGLNGRRMLSIPSMLVDHDGPRPGGRHWSMRQVTTRSPLGHCPSPWMHTRLCPNSRNSRYSVRSRPEADLRCLASPRRPALCG